MPFGGLLSLAAPVLGIGSSLMGMFNGPPASQVQMPQGYQMQNMPGADQGAFGGIGNLGNYNVAGNLLPQYQQLAQQGVNNPYGQNFQQGANMTGAAGMGSGAALTGTGLSQLPNVQALMSLGFDPQQALYSQLQNQNQQQNAAILGQSGVANTPYGAGVQQQANTNFNIDWQNQQLQRAIQGAGGASNLLGQIGNTTGTGLNQMATGAGLPYNTFQNINANALGTLGQAGQFGALAGQSPQQQIQDYLAYLGQGTSQQGANTSTGQLGLNQANSVFNQQQQLGAGLGKGLAGLGSAWGGAFGGGTPNTAAINNSMNTLANNTGGSFYGPGF